MSWNQFNTFLIPRSPRPRRPESPHGTGVLAIPAQFLVAWIVTVTRWAAPPAEIITKSRVSYEFSALFEKLVVLEPEVEQVRFELRMFVPFLPMFFLSIGVFYIAGLYEKQKRPIRRVMGPRIFGAQATTVAIAAILFFILPLTISTNTILDLYLVV